MLHIEHILLGKNTNLMCCFKDNIFLFYGYQSFFLSLLSFTAQRGLGFLYFILQYYSVICRPSDHTVGRPLAKNRTRDGRIFKTRDCSKDRIRPVLFHFYLFLILHWSGSSLVCLILIWLNNNVKFQNSDTFLASHHFFDINLKYEFKMFVLILKNNVHDKVG